MPRKLVIILGPTAVGKTGYAISQALGYGSPVISCDSRQVFREMSIGTAVPSAGELAAVKHYFIQTESVTREYSAADYASDALAIISELFEDGHETLVATGGSMLYIDALCNGLDEIPKGSPQVRAALAQQLAAEGTGALAARLKELDPQTWEAIDRSNGRRLMRALEVCIETGRPYSSFKTGAPLKRDFEIEKIGLSRPREELYARINARVDAMVEAGLEGEVRSLYKYKNLPALQTVGYREIFSYIDGQVTFEDAVALVKQHTRNYAKRQMTWWRRDGSIRWIDLSA